jgi:hypothetical protein
MPMLFSTIDRCPVTRAVVSRAGICASALVLMAALPLFSQAPQSVDSKPAEMLMTDQGFIAIDSPKDWMRAAGPGLAYFVPPAKGREQPTVWIYISSAPVGPHEEAKDLQAYIQSDIAVSKQGSKMASFERNNLCSFLMLIFELPFVHFRAVKRGMLWSKWFILAKVAAFLP